MPKAYQVSKKISGKITKEEVIEYLQWFSKQIDRPIKKKDFSPKGDKPFGTGIIRRYFGNMSFALKEAGVESYFEKHAPKQVECKSCNKKFFKAVREIKRTKNNFCSKSCAGTYSNTHKTTGCRVSKLEKYLQSNLGGYIYDYSNREQCEGLELDIYINALNIAFEINGIFHYKPVFGEDKLNKIIERDKRKKKICIDKGITLYTIKDDSKRFSEDYGKVILNKIYRIIYTHQFKLVILDMVKNNFKPNKDLFSKITYIKPTPFPKD